MDEDYFWFHVAWEGKTKDECWEWESTVTKAGYGTKWKEAFGTCGAHRIAWLLRKGTIPKGMHVLHKCDNKLCCNPRHLFLGTHQDNMKDRNNKGRNKFGEGLPQHKLTNKQIAEIRDFRHSGYLLREISSLYGISQGHISQICNYRTRKQ